MPCGILCSYRRTLHGHQTGSSPYVQQHGQISVSEGRAKEVRHNNSVRLTVLFVKWRNRGKDPYGDIGQETGELSCAMSRQGHEVGLWGTRHVLYLGLCGGHMRVLTLGHVLMLSFMACALFSLCVIRQHKKI